MQTSHYTIITGVSKGIGLATAQLLNEKGYTVAGWGRNAPTYTHPNFHFFRCDVSKLEQVTAAMEQTRNKLGEAVFGLINNAGFGHFGKLEELPIEKWHAMFDTNVHGLMYCSRAVVPLLKAQQAGHIINISSIAGLNGIVQGSGYSATKFAVRGISHSLYAELREDGIKVSCVYPGSVATNFFDEVEGVTINPNMLQPQDVALLLLQLLESSPNFLTVDVEIRPLQPKGKKS
jgi:short-subunit dehydrogenase